MTRDVWLRYFESAPDVVQDYLMDRQRASDNEERAQTKLGYEHDMWERVMDVVWDTLFAGLGKQDFRERLTRLAGDRKPEDVERWVLFYVVSPLADLVTWDVDSRLQELGASMTEIQAVPRISLRPVSYGAAVRRIASQAKITLLSEEMVRRIREIFVSFIKGVRTIEQVREMLQRNQGEGGIGLTAAQTEAFATTMTAFLNTTKVLSEQEYADWLTQFQQGGETRREDAADAIRQAMTPEEAEVASLSAGTPKSNRDVSAALEKAVDAVVKELTLTDLDEYMTKRLRNTVSTRLRDVRNTLQTKAILTRDVKVGGLGFEAALADRIAAVIERVYQEQRSTIVDEEKKHIETTMVEQKTKIDERKTRESEEHAKWFQEKVQSTQNEADIKARMMAALQQSQMPAVKAQVPAGSVSTNGKPLLTDVRPPEAAAAPMRLMGLSEELGGMTLAEFRRLAKDPNQAAEKIAQKLETLHQESFEQWTEGVQAWRTSPLQRQYLKIVADSFAAGKPVAELVKERQTADNSLPTPIELGALIALNSKVQF